MGRGAGAAALGGALIACGLLFDSPSLHVPGVALLALGAGAAGWVWLAARGATLSRTLGPRTVAEEEPYPLRLRFSAGLLPPPGGELIEPLLADPIPVAMRAQCRARVDVRFSRRGRRRLAPPRLVVHDPLWLAAREVEPPAGGEVIVLPRVEPVIAIAREGAGRIGLIGRPLTSVASEIELDSLRPYRPGSPVSRIHWPAVARTGELVERRLAGDADGRPLVVLDARRPATPEALDMAVRATASLALRLAQDGGVSVLLPGDRRPVDVDEDLHGWSALHVQLALVEEVAEPPAASRVRRAGAIFWVTAAADRRTPAGLDRSLAPARFLVAPGPAARGVPVFGVAGCTGALLGRPGRRRAAGTAVAAGRRRGAP